MATISKILTCKVPQVFQSFFPFLPLGSACGLVSCRGSRGSTPLHFAAWDGHESVVERLFKAKAAVDAKDADGRGLRRGWRESLEAWDLCEEVEEMFMVQVYRLSCFRFLWKVYLHSFVPSMFSAPLCMQTRHILLTISAWQSFGATISIQN